MNKFAFAAAAATFLLSAGMSFAADAKVTSTREPCIQRNMLYGWGARDAKTVVVDDRFGRKYLLTVAGWCQDIEWGMGLSIHSFDHSELGCVSRGDWVVAHGGGAMPMQGARCTITNIELYTPEMEKAYKAQKEAAKKAKAAKENPPPPSK